MEAENGPKHNNNSETKTDVVIDPIGMMLVTQRATKAPLKRIGLPKQVLMFKWFMFSSGNKAVCLLILIGTQKSCITVNILTLKK